MTFNLAGMVKMEDIPSWLRSSNWDVAMFQGVSTHWESTILMGYNILVGDKLQGERRCAVIWKAESFEAHKYNKKRFPVVTLFHPLSGRTLRVTSTHLGHSGHDIDKFQLDFLGMRDATGHGDGYHIVGVDANNKMNEDNWGNREELFVATMSDLRILPSRGYTHENYATGRKSILDYLVAEVDYSEANRSDHCPVVSVIRLPSKTTYPWTSSGWGPKLWKNWRPFDTQKYKETISSSFQSGWKTWARQGRYEGNRLRAAWGWIKRTTGGNLRNETDSQDHSRGRGEERTQQYTCLFAGALKKARAVALLRACVLTGRVRDWRQAQNPPAKLPTEFEGEPNTARWSRILGKRVRKTMMVEPGSEEEGGLMGVLENLRASRTCASDPVHIFPAEVLSQLSNIRKGKSAGSDGMTID